MSSNQGKIHPDNEMPDNSTEEAIVLGKSRQATALAMKALSYQKRQTFTNVCCISICPLMMVLISAGLGNLITNLINNSQTKVEYVYCSNVPNMNPLNIPYWTTDSVRFPSTVINETTRKQYPIATVNHHSNIAREVKYITPTGLSSERCPTVVLQEQLHPHSRDRVLFGLVKVIHILYYTNEIQMLLAI
jgi:hypothetical protein